MDGRFVDADRLDALSRALSTAGSRRRALGGFFLGSLGLLSRTEVEEVFAHDLKATCKKKSGEAKKKCLKKAKQHAAAHASETSPPPPLPPAGPTCSDNVKNGDESDIDCGGSCPRCGVNKACNTRNDCASSLCEATSGTCVAQCTAWGEACGAGCVCQPIGTGFAGLACLQMPGELVDGFFNCAGFPPCTWDFETTDPFDAVSCPNRPGEICSVTGLCSGPEEVCLPLCPPSRRG